MLHYRQDRLAGLVKNSDNGTIFFQNVKINFLFFHLSLNKQEATFSPTSNGQVVKTDACQVKGPGFKPNAFKCFLLLKDWVEPTETEDLPI